MKVHVHAHHFLDDPVCAWVCIVSILALAKLASLCLELDKGYLPTTARPKKTHDIMIMRAIMQACGGFRATAACIPPSLRPENGTVLMQSPDQKY